MLVCLLAIPVGVLAGEAIIELDSEQPGRVYWDGKDEQGRLVGGDYRTVDLVLVHANGIFSTFTCRLTEKEKDKDWSGKGRRLKVRLSDKMLDQIRRGVHPQISSTNLSDRLPVARGERQ
jgi:hypothetical protein